MPSTVHPNAIKRNSLVLAVCCIYINLLQVIRKISSEKGREPGGTYFCGRVVDCESKLPQPIEIRHCFFSRYILLICATDLIETFFMKHSQDKPLGGGGQENSVRKLVSVQTEGTELYEVT